MSFPSAGKRRPRFSVAWGAGISLVAFVGAWLVGATGPQLVFGLLVVVLGFILGVRVLARWRTRLLWRLRNRLLVAYVLIGFIPVVLLLLIGLIAAWTVYGKVAVYQVTGRLERLQAELQDGASDLASALEVAATLEGRLRPEVARRILDVHTAAASQSQPPRQMRLLGGPLPLPGNLPAWLRNQHFSGVLIGGQEAELVVTRPVRVAGDTLTAALVVPLDDAVLAYLGRDLGRVSLLLMREEPASGSSRERDIPVGGKSYTILRLIEDKRPLPPPLGWWDSTISFLASHPTSLRDTGRPGPPLVLQVESRVATVHLQLTRRLGEFSGIPFTFLTVFAVLFLILQMAALWIGTKLTRSITAAVGDLYDATQRLQRGDFSARIPHRRDDQLGALSDSFNQMAASLEGLLEESRERQRLEQELEIARQVQEQLFPRESPRLNTLQLVGRCRAARVVSGDYYDYGLAEPGKLIFTIGDICGKGISAALLMATIQSVIRTQVYAGRLEGRLTQLSMAELVGRVNRQLCATTSPEKYSSLFLAHYDDTSRQLTYTNAGHLPPILIRGGHSEQLTAGGPVVGLFPNLTYEQATVELRPGDWLVAFTDGLTEVENSYEEEYGIERVVAFLERSANHASPDQLVEALLAELDQWAPGVEPADDCTVVAARAC
ncbi:MAG: SpoIIE family protein phosphatase [Acidobacteria bacterium]|nr:SpoIIE family protein phosphatase [Acidobacteriota bacterium]